MSIDTSKLLQLSGRLPIIDVRSPGEFAEGHVPGAHSVPLFNDAERAEIGTLYKQVGRQPAVTRGLEIAGAKSNDLVESVRAITSGSEVLVHCWRGGMRSDGFAWLLRMCELTPHVLSGGYKAFRRAAHLCFESPRQIVILGGHTGSGKTRLLESLKLAGEQVVDLEGLANHRGSAFGGIGQAPQPTVEQFENMLFAELRELDPTRPIWMEAESKAIGRVMIPEPVWQQMLGAPAVFLDIAQDKRVELLLEDYGDLPVNEMGDAIGRIKKRLGDQMYRKAMSALECGDLKTVTEITLAYYDKTYTNAKSKRVPDREVTLSLGTAGDPASVPRLREIAAELVASHADDRSLPAS